ncbi:MAG TPA: ester cyclase [Terriglobales bacterium]|nr:ester cyclase [Terriglobales bacterium]
MSAEANKALVRKFLKAWNERDLDTMARQWDPGMVHHTRTGSYGPGEVFTLIAGFMQAFPDLEFEINNMVAEGDYVATRMTARATQRQEFMGIPAIGKHVTCSVMGLVRIVDGRIVEHWNVMDELYLMQQIGLVPDNYLTAMASS